MAIPIPGPGPRPGPAGAILVLPSAAEQRRQADERTTVWVFIWTLFTFKMVTVALIYWASQDYAATSLLAATTWIWFGVPLLAVSGPLIFRYRLLRVRAKRERLFRAEWLLRDSEAPPPC